MVGLAVEELIECLRDMTTMEDPAGMEPEERMASANTDAYLNATKEEMYVAHSCLKKEAKTHLQSDLIDFVFISWSINEEFRKSGHLWSKYGDTEETQLVEIWLDERNEKLWINSNYTISQLKSISQGSGPDRSWAMGMLSIIEGFGPQPGSMVIYFLNEAKQKFHGYPFDRTFFEVRPQEG